MIGILITACLASSPACVAADPRTCVRLRVCQEYFEPIIGVDGKEIPNPTQQQCQKEGLAFIAKPGGWLDSHPSLKFKAWRCAAQAPDLNPKEREV